MANEANKAINIIDVNDVKTLIPYVNDDLTEKLYQLSLSIDDNKIHLLRNKEVIKWILGDLSFLAPVKKENKTKDYLKYKQLEDEWGRSVLKKRRLDLKLDKQWTNKFGEYICEEILILFKKKVNKPVKKEHFQPDLEIDDAIIEVKAGTFFTSGTAGEKILGCPFKYAEVPELYAKTLKIVCIGGAEKICREHYGNLEGGKCSKQKIKFLKFFKENRIEFIGLTDMVRSLISN